jgi:hypothetical protein
VITHARKALRAAATDAGPTAGNHRDLLWSTHGTGLICLRRESLRRFTIQQQRRKSMSSVR